MSSTPAVSTEAKELALISKVELRIALADSDSKLEALLNTYLPPLLLKLASDYPSVRDKVISICEHINARIKLPTIKLPVTALLKQFKDNAAANLVRHFDLVYIQKGLGRIPPTDRVALLPSLVRGLASDADRSPSHGARLFNLLLRIVLTLKLPPRGSKESSDLRQNLGFDECPNDAQWISSYLGKLLLLSIPRYVPAASSAPLPEGLSPAAYDLLTLGSNREVWDTRTGDGLNLTETKVAACKFLSSGAFTDEERFVPALIASSDTNSVIAEFGDDILRRSPVNTFLEDRGILETLLALYLGDPKAPRRPVRPSVQLKLIGLFSKSKLVTVFTAQVIRIVEGGITSLVGNERTESAKNSYGGREASKLREAIVSFANWVARIGSPLDLELIGPQLVYRLRDYIESQGWPVLSTEGDHHIELAIRGNAYEAIGILAKASSQHFLSDPNIDILRWLFTSLSTEPVVDGASVSVEESLASLLQAYTTSLEDEVVVGLRSLLLFHMNLEVGDEIESLKVQRSTRFTALRFANRCLPYSDVTARWMNIIAIGGRPDEREEVVEEGKRGLSPFWYLMVHPSEPTSSKEAPNLSKKIDFPDFAEFVNYLSAESGIISGTQKAGSSAIPELQQSKIGAFVPALAYARRILLMKALEDSSAAIEIELDWEQKLDVAIASNESARARLTEFLARIASRDNEAYQQAFSAHAQALFAGLGWNGGEGLDECGENLLEILSFSKDEVLAPYINHIHALGPSFTSNKAGTRKSAAHVFGILASHEAHQVADRDAMCANLLEKVKGWKSATGVATIPIHGSIMALAYLISRLRARNRLDARSEHLSKEFVHSVAEILSNSQDSTFIESAILAVDQLSTFGLLAASSFQSSKEQLNLVEALGKKAKDGSEKAILCMGHLAMNFPEDAGENTLFPQITQHLYGLYEIRQPEIHFSVGEALSCCAVGWQSKSLMATLDVDNEPPNFGTRQKMLQKMLEKVLSDCRQAKVALKRAACIWLLCMIQYCGHLAEVQRSFKLCQSAFKGFLSDRDELVQEASSRGLILIYQKGDKSLKDDLVRDLLSSFVGSASRVSGNVSHETELFEPGALPTGEGSSVSTYKDIMSLAAEVGNPSLIYQFMAMASSNAVWSSRAAFGRFGLGDILAQSKVEDPVLYSKLFRYRFDPNPRVQASMNDIWRTLVKSPEETVDKHYDFIMEDLLKSIIGKEWRVRQASCAAIADLVQGRKPEKYKKYLGQIWTLAFKVIDDIKESVRGAAMELCRTLSGTLIRSVEAGSSEKDAEALLSNVLPFLMSPSGLEASAKEAQAFALDATLKLTKTGTKSLRPFLPDLIEHLISMLTSTEPQEVNYLHMNASKYNLTENKIDAARLQGIRSSPVMQAIERCLDILDEASLEKLVPHLSAAMKQAVGMPSKVGCSRVLTILSTRHNFLFRRHADVFLKLVMKIIIDRNDTVSASYASAAGYLSRLATDKQILSLSTYSQKLYFQSEDDRHRLIAGDIIQAVSKHATDRFSALAVDFLPFVFVAKHDTLDNVREPFENTWNENTGRTRLYIREIVDLSSSHLQSPRWAIKHAAALSVAELVKTSSATLSEADQRMIWPVLEQAIEGKTWDSKHVVLAAFVVFAKHSQSLQKNDSDLSGKMKKIVIRESKRTNAEYRQHALKSLGQYAESSDEDLSGEVLDLLKPIVEELTTADDAMEVDAGAGKGKSKLLQTTLANAVTCAFAVVKLNLIPRPDQGLRLSQLLSLAESAKTSSSANEIQVAICEGVIDLCGKLQALAVAIPGEDIPARLQQILSPLGEGTTTERTKRALAAGALLRLLQSRGSTSSEGLQPTTNSLSEQLLAASTAERDPSIRDLLARTLAGV